MPVPPTMATGAVHPRVAPQLRIARVLRGAQNLDLGQVRGQMRLAHLGRQRPNLFQGAGQQRVRQGLVAEASLQSPSYHCEAVVTSAGQLIALPIGPIRQALVTDPAFAMAWIAMQAQALKRLRAQCERLSLKRVEDRLLHLLATEGQGGRLSLKAGLKSLAAELGVSHEALYRTIAKLEQQGVLQRTEGQLGTVPSAPRSSEDSV